MSKKNWFAFKKGGVPKISTTLPDGVTSIGPAMTADDASAWLHRERHGEAHPRPTTLPKGPLHGGKVFGDYVHG